MPPQSLRSSSSVCWSMTPNSRTSVESLTTITLLTFTLPNGNVVLAYYEQALVILNVQVKLLGMIFHYKMFKSIEVFLPKKPSHFYVIPAVYIQSSLHSCPSDLPVCWGPFSLSTFRSPNSRFFSGSKSSGFCTSQGPANKQCEPCKTNQKPTILQSHSGK